MNRAKRRLKRAEHEIFNLSTEVAALQSVYMSYQVLYEKLKTEHEKVIEQLKHNTAWHYAMTKRNEIIVELKSYGCPITKRKLTQMKFIDLERLLDEYRSKQKGE